MSRVRKAVITAAGRGTRQYPATSAVQKEMLSLVDRDGLTKPTLQLIIEECVESGIEEICIVCSPGGDEALRNYFKRLDDKDVRAYRGKDWAILESERLGSLGERLSYVIQHDPQGFGHAVYQAKDFVGDDPFVLLLGDHVYISDVQDRCVLQLVKVFEKYGLDAVTGVQPTLEKQLHLFGTIKGNPVDQDAGIYKAELIIEKPSIEEARAKLTTPGLQAGNYLCHFGIHIFSPAIMDSLGYHIDNDLRDGGEIQLTSSQEHLRANCGKYWAVINQGQRYDTGIPLGLMETQLGLALSGKHRQEMCESIARILATQQRV
ncbi:MAG: sugar phosphate nucleotidyltransferase [Planctomycetota bacterium]